MVLLSVAVRPEPAPDWLLRSEAPVQDAPLLGGGGCPSQDPPCPVGQGVGGSGSLGPSNSITHTDSLTVVAKDALLELLDLPDCDIRKVPYNIFVAENFVEYLERCEMKGFWLKGYDTKRQKIVTFPLSYENRWGVVRRRELSEKLERLEYWFELQQDRPVTMITLTSYHAGLGIEPAWFELSRGRDKLLKLIRKYFGDVDYIWVVEPHASGYVHYHLAVFDDVSNARKDSRGKGIEDKFRDLWSRKYRVGSHTYGLDFSQKNGEDKIKSLKRYLSKYLEKGFLLGEWTPGVLLFNAYLHETGFRLYGASRRIREVMKIEDEKPSQVVWLETKIDDVQKDDDGEYYEEQRVIWYRQYIPDWLDSAMWLNEQGNVRHVDPDKLYIFAWGRRWREYDMMWYGQVIQVRPKTRRIQIAGGEWIEVPDRAADRR